MTPPNIAPHHARCASIRPGQIQTPNRCASTERTNAKSRGSRTKPVYFPVLVIRKMPRREWCRDLRIIYPPASSRDMPLQIRLKPCSQRSLEFVVIRTAPFPSSFRPPGKRCVRNRRNHLKCGSPRIALLKRRILRGRKRHEEARPCRFRIRREPREIAIVIGIGINPPIRGFKISFARRALHPCVQANMSYRRRNALDLLQNAGTRSQPARQQSPKRVVRSRIADNRPGEQLAPIRHAHSNRALPLSIQQDFRHFSAINDLSTRLLYHRRDAPRDLRRSANRIRRAFEVMVSNKRVRAETALPRRQTIIAPLPGQYPDQFPVTRKPAQYLSRSLGRRAQKTPSQHRSDQPRNRPRNRLLREIPFTSAHRRENRGNVLVDRLPLSGERIAHPGAKTFYTGRKIIGTVANRDPVIHIRHGVPAQASFRNVIERRPNRRFPDRSRRQYNERRHPIRNPGRRNAWVNPPAV